MQCWSGVDIGLNEENSSVQVRKSRENMYLNRKRFFLGNMVYICIHLIYNRSNETWDNGWEVRI